MTNSGLHRGLLGPRESSNLVAECVWGDAVSLQTAASVELSGTSVHNQGPIHLRKRGKGSMR